MDREIMANESKKDHNGISFWENNSCGVEFSKSEKYSLEYFEEIEKYRYLTEPEIFSFAQFTRFHGKKVLEVGYGAGTDFIQWIRAGARAYGIDITKEGYNNLENRLKVYNLKAEDVKISDCENIPYPDNFFDLVYSWGVIHHTANTPRALEEIIRVCGYNGKCKLMVYNRHSLNSLYLWIKKALLKGKFWKSFSWCIYNFMESKGTKAFTKKEILEMLKNMPVHDIKINTILTFYDRLGNHSKFVRMIAGLLAFLLNKEKVGWFLTIEFEKIPIENRDKNC
jgi:ubiquinone/menaquinone biosynthesis C-methylase UbiE